MWIKYGTFPHIKPTLMNLNTSKLTPWTQKITWIVYKSYNVFVHRGIDSRSFSTL